MLHSKDKVRPPRNLRSARRSLVKNKISTPTHAPAHVLSTPKKIIKALYDYQAQGPHELSFSRGDFFHVTNRENDTHWFEACNPATSSKGLVPASYFQVLDKSERTLTVAGPNRAADSDFMDPMNGHYAIGDPKPSPSSSTSSSAVAPLYGVVLYDFQAERSDELDATAGEPIIVIAQSNKEWFVAKPIGRLGGPGLIPVSFVEVRDAVTGKPITNLTQASPMIPRVEEWKKMTQGYEASSISLTSRYDIAPSPSNSSSLPASRIPFHPQQQQHGTMASSHTSHDAILDSYGMEHLAISDHPHHHHHPGPKSETRPHRPRSNDSRRRSDRPIVVAATIDSYILEGDQYWFIVYVRLSNDRYRVLYRLYEDFYDFQINLLNEYPVEAGKADRERILPYMPGPLTQVDEDITADRQRDLNKYCEELLNLPRYLAESNLVQMQLFGIHEGDLEVDQDPRLGIPGTDDDEDVLQQQQQQHLQPSPKPTPVMVTPTTSMSTPHSTKSSGTVKLKIAHKDDIFAIKVPAHSTLEQLHTKVHDRLGFPVTLQYKDSTTGNKLPLQTEMDMETAFASAIKLGKLTVYAERRT